MTFLLPIGLLALLALPLIALLHLIQRRRIRQRVPSLQLWRGLQLDTLQHKPRRLPLTLLLVLHLLVAALLATALGQPLLRFVQAEPRHTVLIVDTSSSMAATDAQPNRLEDAKREAQTMLSRMRRGDSAALIELSAQPQILAQGDNTGTSIILGQLERLQAGGSDGDLQRALNLAQATTRPNAKTRIVVLTDRSLRATVSQPVAGQVAWRTFGGEGDNVAIVAFAAQPLRNGRQQLYARVANLGTVPTARTLTLDLDGKQVAVEPMNLAPGAEAEWSWPLPISATHATATLAGSDLQPLDDRAFVVLQPSVRTRIQLVSDTTTALERALRAQRGVDVQAVTPARYQPATDADLVVLVGFVPQTLPAAPTLLVAPPAEQSLLKVTGQRTNVQADIINDERFRAIDWRPITLQHVLQVEKPDWADVDVASGDTPLVLTGHFNGQPIAIWTFDPDTTNLANRLQFPLLTAATLRMLLPSFDDLAIGVIAQRDLKHSDGTRIARGQRITQPGFYNAEGIGEIAVNALDTDEAVLQERAQPEIATVVQPALDGKPVGRELWRPLVIGGLLVLIVEWLYINRDRFRRTSRRVSQPLP